MFFFFFFLFSGYISKFYPNKKVLDTISYGLWQFSLNWSTIMEPLFKNFHKNIYVWNIYQEFQYCLILPCSRNPLGIHWSFFLLIYETLIIYVSFQNNFGPKTNKYSQDCMSDIKMHNYRSAFAVFNCIICQTVKIIAYKEM